MQPPDIQVGLELRGTPVNIRTMQTRDKELEAEFVRHLSEESRYYRFHSVLRELTPELLERFTHVNYPQDMALIATIQVDDKEKQIAVARYAKRPDHDAAEVAVVVDDAWQNLGLGRRMLIEIRNVAADAGYHELHMNVLSGNRKMIKLARELNYHLLAIQSDPTESELGKPI